VGTVYVRKIKSRGVEYLQVAENYRDDNGMVRAKVLFGLGRRDQVDEEAIKRFMGSLSRFLGDDEAAKIRAGAGLEAGVEYLGSKEYGSAFLLDGLWRRLGIDEAIAKAAAGHDFKVPVERLLFALVANRALAPSSKLAAESWVEDVAFIDGLPTVEVQQLYRAMDFLLEAKEKIEKEVFKSVSHLFNLEVDLVFVDTTSTYFEVEGEDEDGVDEDGELAPGLRKRSRNSKDKRPDLPQAVIGFAVTRDGIPVKSWVWPGNTVDVSVVEEVKKDLNDWRLSRMVLVMDTGFNSAANRRVLQGAGDHFIIGEKLRAGQDSESTRALKRAGRYMRITENLKAKEVTVNEGSVSAQRFIIVHNQGEAERDAAKRNDIVAETERRVQELGDLTSEEHTKRVCELIADKTFGKYLREQKNGSLKLDKTKITAEAKLDGKYLIRTSDSHLSIQDVVLGYKQLFEIERVNRDLKHTIDVRPVYHRREDRIKSHVLLCWLALLLIRIAETETGDSWHQLKKNFRRLTVGFLGTEGGKLAQLNKLTTDQKRVLDALKVKPPRRNVSLELPA